MNEHSAEVGRGKEERGFRSALFINLTSYNPNCLTPKRDATDNFDKLSIESSTTTTPTSKEKKESKFKFCLSRDFLRSLDEESPIRRAKEDDVKNSNSSSGLEDEEIDGLSTKNENNSDCSFEPFRLLRRPVLNSFSTNNATSDSDSNLTPQKNDSFTENSANGKSNSMSNDSTEKNSFDKNISEGNAPCCKNDTTILNNNIPQLNQAHEDMSLGAINKFNNATQNYMMGNGFYNNSYMFLYGNMNGSSMNNNYANSMQTININGKNGWICFLCIRVKCNRCTNPRPQLLNQSSFLEINYMNNGSNINSSKNTEQSNTVENNKFNPASKSFDEVKNNPTIKKKKPFQEREGDWNCFKCKNLNFSFRVTCNRCQLSKKESENSTNTNQILKKDDVLINSAMPKTDSGKISM